jgi:hypothetical protein
MQSMQLSEAKHDLIAPFFSLLTADVRSYLPSRAVSLLLG